MIDGVSEYELASEAVRSIRDWQPVAVASDRSVSAGQRALYMVNRVEAFRFAGGYLEALRWTEPMVLELAAEGARLLGADGYASLLEAAIAVVFPAGLPRDEPEEEAAWAWFERAARSRMEALDELDERLDLGELLDQAARYVRAHPDEFFDDPVAPREDAAARLAFVDELLDQGQDAEGLGRIRRLLEVALEESTLSRDASLADACRGRLDQIGGLVVLPPPQD